MIIVSVGRRHSQPSATQPCLHINSKIRTEFFEPESPFPGNGFLQAEIKAPRRPLR